MKSKTKTPDEAPRIEMLPIAEVRPRERNPRKHPPEQIESLAKSIREFGFTAPVLIEVDGTLIAGHGRVEAARKAGLERVPCLRVGHLTPAQVRAYVIADNKLALNAGWDDKMLAAELDALNDEGFNLHLTGFTGEELDGLLAEIENISKEHSDSDAVPEVRDDPVTKPGDLWILGNHRLMCGDSTSTADVERLTEGVKAGLVFSDPPYGVEFRSNMSRRFEAIQNDDKILVVAPVVWEAMADNTAAFIWTSHHVYPVWRAQFEQFYKQTIVWHKGGGGMGDLEGQYALDYELALFCTKGSPKFRNARGMAVWQVSKDAASLYVHPTQKPVALAERAICDFSDKRDTVLDMFGGSGSTLIACEKTGRDARLMELDPRYCDVIVERWQKFTGKQAVLKSNGKTLDETKASTIGKSVVS
jgi:DNA modification methylase